MNQSSQEKILRIEMSETDVKNLMSFLNRVDLRGKEVPAFLEIHRAVNKAVPVQKEIKNF